MHCKVDGKKIDCGRIIYRDLGYGSDPGLPLFIIEVEISIDEAKEKFSKPINDFIEQCRIDDSKGKDIAIPEIAKLNYPSAENLIYDHRNLLSEIILDYIYFDVLYALFSKNPSNMWLYSINTIDSVKIFDDVAQIFGKAYAVRTQD